MLIGVVVVVMAKTLPGQLLLELFSYPITSRIVWAAAYGPPAVFGWIILSLAGGSIMHWSLRRGAAAGVAQVLTRFE